jgi:hypothetical protein
MHPASDVQDVPGQLALVPLHAIPAPHAGLPGLPSGAVAHVPSAVDPRAAVHTWHAPPHDVPQQTPSTSKLLAQPAPDVAGWPFLSPHAPAPLHVDVLAQLPCGSVPNGTALHVPLAPPLSAAEQAAHVEHEPLEQQTPSTQALVVHARHPCARQSAPAATLHVAP